jgi:hypothetical protein
MEDNYITYLKSKYKTETVYFKNDLRPWLGIYRNNKLSGAVMLKHLDKTDYSKPFNKK